MKQILFVDDEPNILAGLRRMLVTQRGEWNMRFASSGEEALRLLDEHPADVVVTDMRMPRMDGAALLERVRTTWPRTARIVLSGHADEAAALRSVGVAQQFLAKPCDAEVIRQTLWHTLTLRQSLTDPALLDLVGSIGALPALPESYREISLELAEAEPRIRRIAEAAAGDVAVAAKILQLVNSAFFGLPRRITRLHDAVVVLGMRTLRALVLQTATFSTFADTGSEARVRQLSQASLRVGQMASRLLREEGASPLLCEEAMHAGLLHDIGRLIIAARLPAQQRQIDALMQNERLGLLDAEQRVLGATHGLIGGYLLGTWGMSENVVTAVVNHHTPAAANTTSFNVTLAVHVAEALLAETDAAVPTSGLDMALLEHLHLAQRLDDWRAAVADAVEQEASA